MNNETNYCGERKSCQKGDVDPALGQSWDYYDGSQYFGTIFELHDKNPVPDDED